MDATTEITVTVELGCACNVRVKLPGRGNAEFVEYIQIRVIPETKPRLWVQLLAPIEDGVEVRLGEFVSQPRGPGNDVHDGG